MVAAGVERVVLSHGRNVCAEQLPSEPTGAGWQGRCNAPERGCLRKVCGPWQGQQDGIALRVQCRWPAEIPNFSFAWLSPWQSAAAQCRARMGATSFVNEIDRRSFAGRVSRLEGRRRASTYSFSGMRSGSSWQPMQPRDSRVLTQNQPQVASAMPLVSNVCNSKGVSAGTSTLKEPSTSRAFTDQPFRDRCFPRERSRPPVQPECLENRTGAPVPEAGAGEPRVSIIAIEAIRCWP